MNEHKSPDDSVRNSSSGGMGGAPCRVYAHVFTCVYIKEGKGREGVKGQTHQLFVAENNARGGKMTRRISQDAEDNAATHHSCDY